MIRSIALGARLAVGTRGQWARSLGLAGASALGTFLLLAAWGFSREFVVAHTGGFSQEEVPRLVAGIVLLVALPVVALIGGVARLAAVTRERRLARLRLLGMSLAQVRTVAASEVGVAGLLGSLVGGLVLVGVGSLPGSIKIGGASWTLAGLRPAPVVWIVGLLVTPLVAVVIAAWPGGASTGVAGVQPGAASRRGRRRGARPVRWSSWLRVLPFAAGWAVCSWVGHHPGESDERAMVQSFILLGGMALLGIGLLILIPSFTRLVAAILVAGPRGVRTTLLARRLESQPAGVSRAVGALMVGLFIVTGANYVLQAWEDTPQYQMAAEFNDVRQYIPVLVGPNQAAAAERKLAGLPGVTRTQGLRYLGAKYASDDDWFRNALVATCDDVFGAGQAPASCRDNRITVVDGSWEGSQQPTTVQLGNMNADDQPGPDVVTAPLAGAGLIAWDEMPAAWRNDYSMIIPPDYPAISALVPQASFEILVTAGPGWYLFDEIHATGLMMMDPGADKAEYDYVQGLRSMANALTIVVVGVGLLGLAVALIDRAASRRRELTALRLLGTPTRILGWVQWWEAALPIVAGSVLAIVAGAKAGGTYLKIGDLTPAAGVTHWTWALAAVAVLLSCVLAGFTVIGTGARLRPGDIRVE